VKRYQQTFLSADTFSPEPISAGCKPAGRTG
jgi:hypothetical protein